jgi:hypothetical protein
MTGDCVSFLPDLKLEEVETPLQDQEGACVERR